MWLTMLAVVIGGLITIGTAICIENLRRSRLVLYLSKPIDADYRGQRRPAGKARFLSLTLYNADLPWLAKWMSRNPATQCHGSITFHHLDGQNFFGRSMPIRWHGAPEPIPMRIDLNNQTLLVHDPTVWTMQRVDVYPGESRVLNLAVRFDNEDECFGWCNESYFSKPIWRNPEWQLPRGRYLVRVTITSAGQRCTGTFRLVNDVPVADFRIIDAQEGDIARD